MAEPQLAMKLNLYFSNDGDDIEYPDGKIVSQELTDDDLLLGYNCCHIEDGVFVNDILVSSAIYMDESGELNNPVEVALHELIHNLINFMKTAQGIKLSKETVADQHDDKFHRIFDFLKKELIGDK